jgi:hypothetical protein
MVRAEILALKSLRSHRMATSIGVWRIYKGKANQHKALFFSASKRRGYAKLQLKTKFPYALGDSTSVRYVDGSSKFSSSVVARKSNRKFSAGLETDVNYDST